MVVDTSVFLAVFFMEKHGPACINKLNEYAGTLLLSAVNYSELLIRVTDRHPQKLADVREQILSSGIEIVPVDSEQAEIAAKARMEFPLNLGDCFAYALASLRKIPVMTLDTDFGRSDIEVIFCHE